MNKDSMNVEEVKQERVRLAADIADLIYLFQERTGTVVKDVTLRQFMTAASNVPVKTEVQVRIEL